MDKRQWQHVCVPAQRHGRDKEDDNCWTIVDEIRTPVLPVSSFPGMMRRPLIPSSYSPRFRVSSRSRIVK